MIGFVFVCALSMPASAQDLASYQQCSEYDESWTLGAEWSTLVNQHFKEEDRITAYKIIGCESSGFANAKNQTSTATGLWQFIDKTWGWVSKKLNMTGSPLDPLTSTRYAAFLKYKTSQGWGHWSESAHCWKEPNEKLGYTEIN